MTKKELAIEAIDQMHSDTSVPISQTRDDLDEIIEHYQVLKESLGDE